MIPFKTTDQESLPDLSGFGVTLRDGSQLRVMRTDGVWRVAAKLTRYNREQKQQITKWFMGEDKQLEWAIAKLYDRIAPSDPDRLLAVYIIETKVGA